MPKNMRGLITILTITVLGLNNVFGCVCYDLDYKKMLKTYDYVVIGRPTTNIHPDSVAVRLLNDEGQGSEVFFKIEKIIKGEFKHDNIIIYQIGRGSCLGMLRLGDRYLVFGHKKNYAPPPPRHLSPIVEVDSLTGKEEIIYVPFDNTSIVGDYIKTIKDNYDIVYTGLCGLFSERTKFYRQTRKWRKDDIQKNNG